VVYTGRNLVGASENVYVTKLELEADLARKAALEHELIEIHVKMIKFKASLREKIAETRVMEPSEFWNVAKSVGIFENVLPSGA
jgi:hypothetical protein